jgi:hypothetical protein
MPQTFKGTQLHGLTRPGNRATFFALEAGEIFITFVLLMLAFIVALSLPSPANAAENPPPVFHYWHMWTDTNGVSHLSKCEMHNFVLKSMKPPAAPQWQDRLQAEGATVIVTVQPAGWVGTWHEDPKPQWIIPLSGHWFVETMDGRRQEMGPGEVLFGEDQDTRPDSKGRKGHLSGTVGHEPTVLMVIQLKDAPTINQPCHFK